MRNLIAPAGLLTIGALIGFAFVAATGSPHAGHNPEWLTGTPDEIRAFRQQSDAKIDAWAGRTVAPGEVIMHQGLEFRKSTPADYQLAQNCRKCPMINACHN
jgi:hypothetical protein